MLQSCMAEDAGLRLENFKRYWGDHWSPSAASLRLGKSQSFWSDLWRGHKSFGEKLAREIEDKLGLMRMSLDDPDGPRPSPLSPTLLDHLLTVPEHERLRAENMLRVYFGLEVLPTSNHGPSGKRDGTRG